MRLFLLILLLSLGAPFHASAQKYTLNEDLLYRINFGSAEDVRVLLDKGADPNARTRQGETALEVAIARSDPEFSGIATALIEKGADPDEQDRNGNAPLINAVKKNSAEVVRALLLKHANYHITDGNGISLIQFTKQHGDPETLKIIQDIVGKEDAYNQSLRSPEHFKNILRHYALSACSLQYWTYFQESRQEPEKDEDSKAKVETDKKSLYQLAAETQQYFPASASESLKKTSALAAKQIYNDLDSMVSNRNRAEKGIGQETDVKTRCEKIVGALDIDVASGEPLPNAVSATDPAPSAHPTAAATIPSSPQGSMLSKH